MAQARHAGRTEGRPAPAKPEPAAKNRHRNACLFFCPEIHNMERGRFGFCGIILTHRPICGNEQRQIDNFDTSA